MQNTSLAHEMGGARNWGLATSLRSRAKEVRMRQGVVFVLLVCVGLPAWAGERPVAVSPGSQSSVPVVEARCPAFSWGSAPDAAFYELEVYHLAESGEAEPIVRERIHGSASSWTPAFGQCLVAGGRYAWSIRAVRAENAGGSSEWSEPSLFEVATGPTESEFEAALALVRRVLSGDANGEGYSDAAADIETASGAGPVAESPEESPVAPVIESAKLSVDGRVVAGSFTGDGSTLTDPDPANLAPGTGAINISGNAATATDSDTLDGIDSWFASYPTSDGFSDVTSHNTP